jgi:hypothetical protein
MNMTLHDIPKVKAGCLLGQLIDPDTSAETRELAEQASSLLGYTGLSAHLVGSEVQAKLSGPLTESLLKLDIQVLDTNSVISYQLEEAMRRTKEVIGSNLKNWVSGWFGPANWGNTGIEEYRQPIPQFVLNKAVQIKKALPDVMFRVQHLNDAHADPFLVAVRGDEVYYIDAWDEPKFEERL